MARGGEVNLARGGEANAAGTRPQANEAGMVTAELAIGMLALAVVVALALGLLSAGRDYLGVQDVARSVAVEVARGRPTSEAIAAASAGNAGKAGVDVRVRESGESVRVTATKRASGPAGRLGIVLRSDAAVAKEPGE